MDDISNFGSLLKESWKIKKSLASKISNNEIDDLYNKAIKLGAQGGKILGAGGGGFLYLYADHELHEMIVNKLRLRKLNFNFENEGTQIIYNK